MRRTINSPVRGSTCFDDLRVQHETEDIHTTKQESSAIAKMTARCALYKWIEWAVAEIWPFAYLGHMEPPFWGKGRSYRGSATAPSKERWWFPVGSLLWPLRYLLPFGRNLRSNVSDAQINRGRVSLGQKGSIDTNRRNRLPAMSPNIIITINLYSVLLTTRLFKVFVL